MDSNELNKKIITLVRQNTVLWKWDGKNNKIQYEEGWKIISKEIGIAVSECMKQWKVLEDRFARLSNQNETNWIYYTDLMFLKDKNKRDRNITKNQYKTVNKSYKNIPNDNSDDEFFSNNHSNLYQIEDSKEEVFEDENIILKDFSIKYGEIFFYQNGFVYLCVFCKKIFCNIDLFSVHCLSKHIKQNPSGDVSKLEKQDYFFVQVEESSKSEKNENSSIEKPKPLHDIQKNERNNIENDITFTNNHIFKSSISYSTFSEVSSNDEENNVLEESSNLKCALCSFITTNLKKMSIHGNEHHPNEAIFKCYKCPQVFVHFNKLLEHQIICGDYLKYNCNMCQKKFKSKRNLKEHHIIHQLLNSAKNPNLELESYYKCGLCTFETLEREYYLEHCKKNHPKKSAFKCDSCESLFSNIDLLEIHKTDHNPEKIFKCNLCDKNFLYLKDLTEHHLTHTNLKIDNMLGRLHREILKCGSCNYETQVVKLFLKHCEEHVAKGETPFKCWVCNKIFKTYRYLIYHRRLHRRLNDSACSFCGKIFDSYRSLRDHEHGHEGKRKIYRCKYCPKEFHSLEIVHDHENNHIGNRPYKCKFCERDFSIKSTWRTHIRVKHLNDKRFECKICGLKYLKKRECIEHEASHSGNKLYMCYKCGNSFTTNASLMSHLKSHENLRDYKCEICGKGFNNKTNLDRHIWVHCEEKNFECEICKNKFICKRNLQRHMKTHYKNILFNNLTSKSKLETET